MSQHYSTESETREMTPDPDPAPVSPGARRVRRYMERRRNGIRCLTIELSGAQIEALIAMDHLAPADRDDLREIHAALRRFFDEQLRVY
jgi:hypothetical protein